MMADESEERKAEDHVRDDGRMRSVRQRENMLGDDCVVLS